LEANVRYTRKKVQLSVAGSEVGLGGRSVRSALLCDKLRKQNELVAV